MCAIVLFAIGAAFAGRLSMGEYLSEDEYKDLTWQSFAAGGIWILVTIITGISYYVKAKKQEKLEAAHADTELSTSPPPQSQ